MDRKFKMYYKIADEAEALSKRLLKEREDLEHAQRKRKEEADKLVNAFNKQMQQSKKEKLQNGGYAEYANMITSIFNSEHLNQDGQNK